MIGNAVLVVLLGLAWGVNWPMARLALDDLPPWGFRSIGFSVSAAILFAVIRLRRESPAVPRSSWLRLAAVGALSVIGYNLFSAFAQLSASTSRSAVLSYTMPIWAVIFARLVADEPIDRRRVIGLALGIAGLLALGVPIIRDGELSWGILHAVLSGVVWAAGSVVLKRWPLEASPLVTTAWQLLIGAVATSIGAACLETWPPALPTHAGAWIGLAYNVFIAQAFGTTLWFVILARMPAGIASIGTLLVPAFGVVGATMLLGERPTAADWTGLVLIVAASAVVLVRGAAPAAPAAPAALPPATDRIPAAR